jgi:serine/threonine protein kinase
MWSIGCIFFEIAHKKPLFYGDSEIGQIFKIFRMMGTPADESWQGIMDLPEMKGTFPKWKPRDLAQSCTQLDALGVDLLSKMVQLEPSKRISA